MSDEKTIGSLCARVSNLEHQLGKVVEKQDLILDQVSMYRGMIKGIKFLGAVLLALLAFKFGDVSRLWEAFLE